MGYALISFYLSIISLIQHVSCLESNPSLASEPLLVKGYQNELDRPNGSSRPESGWESFDASDAEMSADKHDIPASGETSGVPATLSLSKSPSQLPTTKFHIHKLTASLENLDRSKTPRQLIPEGSGLGAQKVSSIQPPNESSGKFSTIELDRPKSPITAFERFPTHDPLPQEVQLFLSRVLNKLMKIELDLRSDPWAVYQKIPGFDMSFYQHIANRDLLTTSWIGTGNKKRHATVFNKFFEELISRILITHTEFLRHYPTSPDKQAGQLHALFEWLWYEVFQQTKDHPPVLGRFTGINIQNEILYRPIQRVLVNWLLRNNMDEQDVHILSLRVVGTWYKSFEAHLWNSQFRTDQDFWALMNKSPQPPSQMTANDQGDQSHRKPFELHPDALDDFKEVLPPPPFADNISQRITRLFELYPSPTNGRNIITCANPPVSFYPVMGGNEGKELFARAVRPTGPAGKALTKYVFKQRMWHFLRTIHYLHHKLCHYLPVQSPREHASLAEEFFCWFDENAFDPAAGASSPIMGKVNFRDDLEGGRAAPDNMHGFGPLQAYWIRYLSDYRERGDNLQASATTWGYWFFKSYPDLWKTHFGTEARFYNTVITALRDKN
ncbi:hypothetical protein VP01_723g5 [Puccinia sorghi]|uniref:Uncharacterized protein n=1 Tax=Puccinia sorghi TaxID=27349 RepID=A0A0L6UD73_9BASI|nr:hypothetical protein VP01_723g5 [Puccinia sorghi]